VDEAKEALFEEALSRPPEDRAAFLRQACAGRPDLRAAVEALTAPKDSPRLANALAQSGLTLLQIKAFADAEPHLRECLTIREKTQPDVWNTFNTRSMLGGALLGRKRYAEAEPLLVSGYDGMKRRAASIPPPGRDRLTEALERLVRLYESWDKPLEAARWRATLAGGRTDLDAGFPADPFARH
jgi:hypothetical protein